MPYPPHVLVVEDDHHFAEILATNLESSGYFVTVATDGRKALQAFETEHPAAVILDLNLPEVSGFRLTRLFKRFRPQIPVLIVTALDFQEAIDVAHDGADDFLTKPVDPQMIVRSVARRLNGARSLGAFGN